MKREIVKTVGIWFLAIALFVAHVFFRSVAHAEGTPPPQESVMKNGDCHIDFPTTPQVVQQSFPIADGSSRLSYDIYLSPFETNGVFLLLVATYPMDLSGGHEIAGLEGLITGIVNHHPDNKLVYADLTQSFAHPAISFLVESGTSYFRGQAMMVGNKLFLIAMEGRKGTLNEAIYAKFLKSFKLKNQN